MLGGIFGQRSEKQLDIRIGKLKAEHEGVNEAIDRCWRPKPKTTKPETGLLVLDPSRQDRAQFGEVETSFVPKLMKIDQELDALLTECRRRFDR
jgi:hypothetical protein